MVTNVGARFVAFASSGSRYPFPGAINCAPTLSSMAPIICRGAIHRARGVLPIVRPSFVRTVESRKSTTRTFGHRSNPTYASRAGTSSIYMT